MGSKLGVSWFGSQQFVATTIARRSATDLSKVLATSWNINETLDIPDHRGVSVSSTALCEAARRGWTQGVELLLEAGANCKVAGVVNNPLTLALRNPHCPTQLILLLLEHGMNPNDHEGSFTRIPLVNAITNCRYTQDVRIVQLLLEYGADPNVTCVRNFVKEYPVFAALQGQEYEVLTSLLRTLLKFGLDVNHNVHGQFRLLCKILTGYLSQTGPPIFPQEHLDLIFQFGGNIKIEDGKFGTVLEYAVRKCSNSNSIRWLIRHGVETSHVRFTLLKDHFTGVYYEGFFPETPLILLQAGMRVSHGAQRQLRNMERVIRLWLEGCSMHLKDGNSEDNSDDGNDDDEDIFKEVHTMWVQLEKAEEEELQRVPKNTNKATFPEYWSQQMVDLQDFSGESLSVYPEVTYTSHTRGRRQQWLNILDQIHRVLGFLSQPQSLLLCCRSCVRENLVSLQPSVVKTLPGPMRLKQYISCHEI